MGLPGDWYVTKKLALLGKSLEHSISPAMQQAAFRLLGLDWRYEARPVNEADLGLAVSRMRDVEWVGANITLPYKERIVELLDSLDSGAARIGAVNTIAAHDGRLVGHNTDATALINDLRRLGVALRDRPALILGAGGAARAAAWGLGWSGAQLTLIARTRSRADEWAKQWESEFGRKLPVRAWRAPSFVSLDAGSLIVNATPLGMWPRVEDCPWPDRAPFPHSAVVYDMVYRPRRTELVRRAEAAGLEAWTGLGMLVEQGAQSLELWTDLKAPRDAMWTAAMRELEVKSDQLSHRR